MRPHRQRASGHRWLAAATSVILLVSSGSTALAAGKPGYPDRISWGGVSWQVKSSRSAVGPGPNLFDKANAFVDAEGRLHLRIAKNAAGTWTAAEIIGPTTYGYGTYTFNLTSSLHDLDPNVVLGLFTWSDRSRYAHREIDIEFSRWGDAADPTNAQYVVQPYSVANHLTRFTQPASPVSAHAFTWRPGRIDWLSHDGTGATIAATTYTGGDVPPTGDERVRLNLWLFGGAAPTNGQQVEVIVDSFTFTP